MVTSSRYIFRKPKPGISWKPLVGVYEMRLDGLLQAFSTVLNWQLSQQRFEVAGNDRIFFVA